MIETTAPTGDVTMPSFREVTARLAPIEPWDRSPNGNHTFPTTPKVGDVLPDGTEVTWVADDGSGYETRRAIR